MNTPILDIEDLRVEFGQGTRTVQAVRGISLQLAKGEVLGVVGESGSGKSVAMMSVARLLDEKQAKLTAKRLDLDGQSVLGLKTRQLEKLRGPTVSYIFQDPLTSLNPVLTVGHQISEGLRRHQSMGRADANKAAIDLLQQVGIPAPNLRVHQHPHEASGGMRQRMMIAMALALRPKLLIADEPTTALDVTVQADIIRLVQKIQAEIGMAMIWVTHDLALLARVARRVVVMYGGLIVEDAPSSLLYSAPAHPYTRGLLASTSRFDIPFRDQTPIPGTPPDPTQRMNACAFAPRCSIATDLCRTRVPPLEERGGRRFACFHPLDAPT